MCNSNCRLIWRKIFFVHSVEISWNRSVLADKSNGRLILTFTVLRERKLHLFLQRSSFKQCDDDQKALKIWELHILSFTIRVTKDSLSVQMVQTHFSIKAIWSPFCLCHFPNIFVLHFCTFWPLSWSRCYFSYWICSFHFRILSTFLWFPQS